GGVIPMTTHLNRAIPLLLAALLLPGLTGCTPKPKPPHAPSSGRPAENLAAEADTQPKAAPFGTFNLHNRHGRGGWDAPPHATERDVLQGMRQAAAKPSEKPR